jgi:membrane-bound lytic murein transglycosylase D
MSPVLPAAITVLLGACATVPVHAEPPNSAEPGWDEPAVDPGAGSLWDYVEEAMDGQPPPEQVVRASGELAAERSAELGFLEVVEGRGLEEAMDWYRDPLAYLTEDPLFLDRLDPDEFDLPLVVNDEVELWMRYFTGSGRKYYARYLARSTRYRPMIQAELAAREMPQDLFYLAMIESGFSPQAYSKASAVGLWQFMAPTARAYHLRVEWWVDERRDPERATTAALDHLLDLHEMFGDWYLAAAAYNAGAGRVRGAMRKTGGTDYWSTALPGYLARETRSYVPKLIAAAIIGHHPERYGFTGITFEPELTYDTVEAPHSSTIESLAGCAGLDEAQFQELNPALRRWALPPEPDLYAVHVPSGLGESFASCVAAIPPSERVSFTRHTVARGESLGSIAKRYDVSVDDIVRMNKIANRNRIYVGTELVIPVPGTDGSASAPPRDASVSSTPSAAPSPSATTWHTVRAGENLAGIGARYGASVQDLLAWNDLGDPDRIQVGQRLRVGAGTPASSSSVQYTIKSGDTLSGIAAHFGISAAQLQRDNNIANAARIKVGQVLEIRTDTTGWSVYTVKSGDTLGAIARRHGCTVSDLQAWNGLKSSTIHPGQQLRIQR